MAAFCCASYFAVGQFDDLCLSSCLYPSSINKSHHLLSCMYSAYEESIVACAWTNQHGWLCGGQGSGGSVVPPARGWGRPCPPSPARPRTTTPASSPSPSKDTHSTAAWRCPRGMLNTYYCSNNYLT